ncbi:regulatory protein RecX [Demequina sp. NBRC 110055]|uniref:regulatory protein RecX n=1 Tax=Demequina sp. NBRC 110055 TaxID=1570344 RepID=UPI000A01464F|nr:regulatory protein RecX [Demequina sp. NBRC 110055]
MPRAPRADASSLDPAERAREIALRLLTHSARSRAQLREGLVSRDVDEDLADEIVARYEEVGLLDDGALASTIARTRHQERGKSRRAISQELARKGFDAAHVDEALAQISDEDEYEAARALGRKRWDQLAGVDHDARVRRVVGMLGRKGYSPSVAFALVKDFSRADDIGA